MSLSNSHEDTIETELFCRLSVGTKLPIDQFSLLVPGAVFPRRLLATPWIRRPIGRRLTWKGLKPFTRRALRMVADDYQSRSRNQTPDGFIVLIYVGCQFRAVWV